MKVKFIYLVIYAKFYSYILRVVSFSVIVTNLSYSTLSMQTFYISSSIFGEDHVNEQ